MTAFLFGDEGEGPYVSREEWRTFLASLQTWKPQVSPNDAQYLTAAPNDSLTAERVGVSSPTILVDYGTAGQAKWHANQAAFGAGYMMGAAFSEDGNDGPPGRDGTIGVNGAPGPQGAAVPGPAGLDGEDAFEWAIPGVKGDKGDAGPSALLAVNRYAPATNTTFSTTSTTVADMDTTNMVVTFTAPASGKVIVRLSAYADISSNAQQYFWCLRDTSPALISGASLGAFRGTDGNPYSGSIYITGLTPSASVTYRWAHGVTGGATGRVIAGPGVTSGTVSTSNMFQPAVMEVFAAP